MSLIPVRCITCGRVIANKWEPYVQMIKDGKTVDESLRMLNITAPCCRTVLLTHVDTLDRLLRYQAMETKNMRDSMSRTAASGIDGGNDSGED